MDLDNQELEATRNLPCNKKKYKLEDSAEKVLDELLQKPPEELNGEAKRLFEAIMQIADERDEAKADLYECNNIISDQIDVIRKQDKMIDKMAKEICLKEFLRYDNLKEVKQYYEQEVENE